MGNKTSLVSKSVETLKREGIGALCKKTKSYIGKKLHRTEHMEDVFMDVLFINGCYLPHPARYRVSHQREQLYANSVFSSEVLFDNLTLDLVKQYRLFVFFRCPYTETVGEFIKLAKSHNKTVLFDIDDLVIDQKYTDQIKYVQNMSQQEKALYDDGVNRMRQTLLLCDGVITTTERLADELRHYVPEVFINRNVASDRMFELSNLAIYNRDTILEINQETLDKKGRQLQEKARERAASNTVRIGYFSGSITHNADIDMITPALKAIMERHRNVELCFAGEMDVPEILKPFEERIVAKAFTSWEKLPEMIASVDINIAPLENTIFNEAKSENKWVEASLVKVPTVASRVGAFARMIVDGETGLLCDNNEDWVSILEKLIVDPAYRGKLAENAHDFVVKHATTIETGLPLANYLRSKMKPNLMMVLPSTQISGGVLVAMKHCMILSQAGVDVTILSDGPDDDEDIQAEDQKLFVLCHSKTQFFGRVDKAVATLWSTLDFVKSYANIGERLYLVQGYETNFFQPGQFFRLAANQTYSTPLPIRYITISRWCQSWLKDKYGRDAGYARNGINLGNYPVRERAFTGKIRILVEGNSNDYFKNVDESFRIVEKLDREKYEVWYMSYHGKPKNWYRVDRFLLKVPNNEVGKVYEQCDILLKSSLLESFSYPPLEMMATGGYCVVAPNGGNAEYLVDEQNCLLYELGNTGSAIHAIERICEDQELRKRLFDNGLETASSRDWNRLTEEVLELYGGNRAKREGTEL